MKIDEKGKKLYEEGKVRKEIDSLRRVHFIVQGETEEHSVIFDKGKRSWTCDCRYSALQNRECSHIVAARIKSDLR